ncbi:hypothetical protein [Variovorax sp. SRS16]|uniref:hypothetical protein n=1 Tax=Variovorax sp. SRS16 TaxID=282217 RepID=UPI0013A56F7B|nr:hypothetical protein [Variovorax sp. SRS16]
MRQYHERSTEERQRLIESTMAMIREAATERQIIMSADMRVSERDAASLIGYTNANSLKNLRQAGQGPVFYHRPVNGSRVSYRLMDLAMWVEERREL